MSQIIIYPQEHNLAFVIPTMELPIQEVARKDVPAGVPYLIVNETELPDNSFLFADAWEADFLNPHGVGIGQNAWFIEQYEAEIAAINAESTPARTEDQTDEEYAEATAKWEESKIDRIAQLNRQIATQQAEIAA